VGAGRHPAGELQETARRRQLEGRPGQRPGKKGKPTTVFLSTAPAELILLQGAPNYQLVTGTSDCCGSATPKATSSGWARPGRSTSWSPGAGSRRRASPAVDVRDAEHAGAVQADSPRTSAFARAGVGAGHRSGGRGRAAASIPQTARVSRKEVKAPEVAYQAIRSSSRFPRPLSRAPSTPTRTSSKSATSTTLLRRRVVRVESADRAMGRGRLDPKTIYEIPVSSPSHSVTYVTVEDSNDEWVTFAAAAAFTGVMIAWGCAVWAPATTIRRTGDGTVRIRTTIRTIPPTGTARRTTRGRERMGAASWRTALTAAPAWGRAITRGLEPMPAEPWRTDRMARAARRRPTTRGRARTRRPARAPALRSWGTTGVQRGTTGRARRG